MDQDFKEFIDKWDVEHRRGMCGDAYLNRKEWDRGNVKKIFGGEEVPVDYNGEVVRLSSHFINRRISAVIDTELYDKEYKQRYSKWMNSLRERDFQLITSVEITRKKSACVYLPELSTFVIVYPEDVIYLSHWQELTDTDIKFVYEKKLKELMGAEEAEKFFEESRRRRLV